MEVIVKICIKNELNPDTMDVETLKHYDTEISLCSIIRIRDVLNFAEKNHIHTEHQQSRNAFQVE